MAVEAERVALVTGASSGIGEAAAHELVAAGFTVYRTSRRAVAGEDRDGLVFLPLDVTDDQSVAGAVREVLRRSGRIDVLVNNAGLGVAGAAEESSIEQARALFDTNLSARSAWLAPCCRRCGSRAAAEYQPQLRPRLGSSAVRRPLSATKHAMEGYSESLDHEVRERRIPVLLVEPACTRTPFDTTPSRPINPSPRLARRRQVFEGLIGEAIKDRDKPSMVGEVIVSRPPTRPEAPIPASRSRAASSKLRRFAPRPCSTSRSTRSTNSTVQ